MMKNKNVLILTASPNPTGNTAAMARVFEDGVQARGAQVTRFDMYHLKGEGCRACMACRTTTDYCVVRDGVGDVLDAIKKADVIVIAAPVWFIEFPVGLRRLIERFHALIDNDFNSRLPSGKKAVLIVSQGDTEENMKEVPARYVQIFNWLGVNDVQVVRHCNAEECAAEDNLAVLDACRDAAAAC